MLRAYADEHVVFAVVEALRRRGMDVVTVHDRRKEATDDDELLAEALREKRVMLTNDQDFLVLAAHCIARNETFAPIFFWPQQRRRVGEVVRSVIREATHEYDELCSRVHYL